MEQGAGGGEQKSSVGWSRAQRQWGELSLHKYTIPVHCSSCSALKDSAGIMGEQGIRRRKVPPCRKHSSLVPGTIPLGAFPRSLAATSEDSMGAMAQQPLGHRFCRVGWDHQRSLVQPPATQESFVQRGTLTHSPENLIPHRLSYPRDSAQQRA